MAMFGGLSAFMVLLLSNQNDFPISKWIAGAMLICGYVGVYLIIRSDKTKQKLYVLILSIGLLFLLLQSIF